MLNKKLISLLRIFKHIFKIQKIRLTFIFFKYIFFKDKIINRKFDKSTVHQITSLRSFSRIKYAHQKEPLTQKWINNMSSGSVFWDVGANVGIFTFLAAQKNLKVVAFEPLYSNFFNLSKTLENNINLYKKVIVLPFALDSSFKISKFLSKSTSAGYSGGQFDNIILSEDEDIKKSKIVSINDKYLNMILPDEFKSPQYIKIDVDGNDFRILQNLENNLIGNKIISLMIESEDRATQEKIINYLLRFDMHLFNSENTTESNTYSKNLFFKKNDQN